MSNELPEKPNALQKLMARFRNAAKGFRGGYADEISSLRGEVDSYKQGEQEVREMRQEAEARADKLSKWEIEIRKKAYNVAGRERANEERAEELSNYSNALNKRAQEIEIEATKRAHILLDEYKKDLSNREEALSDKEARVGGLERLLKDDRILPENEAPKKTATRLAFISRMRDLQGQLDVLDSICSELNGVPDKEEAEDIDRNRYNILGRFLALITMDEITKRTK